MKDTVNIRSLRQTTQDLMPACADSAPPGQYDIYPAFPIGEGKIGKGFTRLADHLAGHRHVVIDGFGGVLWEPFQQQLDASLRSLGLQVSWVNVDAALRPEAEIEKLTRPFLGGDDPLFGTRFDGEVIDFFRPEELRALTPDPNADVNIVYGTGAALAGWDGLLVYVDVPKNEVQFRARSGCLRNFGSRTAMEPKPMYKRFYFVDWVALNRRKAQLLPQIDLLVDEQRPTEPTFIEGEDLRDGLDEMAHNFFRVRPWFEPGPWGGQWIKDNIPQLPEAPNYAWSFELIVPENGLVFSSGEHMLETSFDMLMYHDHQAVLGASADVFGFEFPIRFDFLDTFDGGNLSVQCHPRPQFMHENFGESFTQDETYYIFDCKPGAKVYLGFRDEIDPTLFRQALERSFEENKPLDVERYVNTVPSHKHDLFLIPGGTIHSSGVDNLVLEISATPYIFTFKMYDWMSVDLDGKPRPLNIERAFENLYFDRKGKRISEEFVSTPTVLRQGDDWQLVHLPTHAQHFYDVHRFDFATSVEAETDGSCHVLNLVEGRSVILETARGLRHRFNYAETFVIPAAAGSYRLTAEGGEGAKVVKAFVKPDVTPASEYWRRRIFHSNGRAQG